MAATNKDNNAHICTMYLKDDIKELGQILAKEQGRSFSNFISWLIVEFSKKQEMSHNSHS